MVANLDTALGFARAYRDLGWAVQEQLDDIVERGQYEGLEALDEEGALNRNAVEMIREFVQNYSGEFDGAEDVLEAVDEWLEGR